MVDPDVPGLERSARGEAADAGGARAPVRDRRDPGLTAAAWTPDPTARPDILLVLPNLGGGGAERITVNLANAWTERGVVVDLVLLQGLGPLASSLEPEVNVLALEKARSRNAILPLARYLRMRRPRSILAAMPPSTWIAAIARCVGLSGARLMVAEHFDWSAQTKGPPDATSPGFKIATHLTYQVADVRVAVSAGVADSIARIAGFPRRSIHVVHNPVTPLPPDGETDPAIMAGWGRHGRKRIIAVGSMKPAKDFPTLLRAVSKIRERQDVDLLIVGDGGLRPEIQNLGRALGLDDCLSMPGFVPNPQAYLRQADLFMLSSVAEGLPTVLIEALACGVPVVSTDCPSGPREILCDGRYGALTPTRDPDALAAAALTALSTPHDAAAQIERSMDFSIDAAAERYLRLLLPTWRSNVTPLRRAA